MVASSARRAFLLFAAFVFPLCASAATTSFDFKVLIDADNNAATGCTVVTSSGLFKGVEQVLTTRVAMSGTTGSVTNVVRQTCTDPVANTFSSEIPVDATGWPVGFTSGGSMIVETHLPMSAFATSVKNAHLAFTVSSGTQSDVILAERDGDPILSPAPLPPHHHAASHGTSGRTITLDGSLADWDGFAPLASGAPRSFPTLRLMNAWAYMTDSQFFFAMTAQANKDAPTANDDTYTVVSGGTLGIAVPGVLTNDTDPNNKPLTAILVNGPAHGTLTLNANGSFNYTNDGSPAIVDHFEYKASNGTLDSNTALVTINITPNNPPPSGQQPQFTSPNNATFRVGQLGTFLITTTGEPTPAVTKTSGTLPTGLTILFAPGGGTILGTPAVGTGGTYLLTFQATNVHGTATQNFTLTVNEPPAILSANSTTFTAGTVASFTITTRGFPKPAITESGALPAGITLTDNHNGTATLGGTPTATSGGTYPITINAANIVGSANQSFTLSVNQQPLFTSANATTFTAGAAGTFSVTTSAFPTANVTLTSGTLPAGVTFTPNGTGGGTLGGTPAAGTGGSYPLTFTAANGIGTNATQSFTLTVNEAPSFTSANNTTFTTSTPGTFTVTVLGFPIPAIGKSGTLPSGVTFVDNGNRTATLSGTPGAATGGTYPLTLTATNSVSSANQSFTLTVNQPPVITSTNSLRVQQGTPVTFTVTTTGFPPPSINESGALPNGLTFADNGNGTGTISGTPLAGSGGVYPITFTATNAAGSSPRSFTITACNTIAVTDPATTTGTANAAFSQTFTQTGAVGGATFTTASTLPAGLSLSTGGVLSGTPSVIGTFPIVVTVTDANGCSGSGATYNLVISCQTITVINPVTNSGTANTAFSQTFTAGNTIGAVTFSTSSALPAGLSLGSNGTLSGTPSVVGTFPIVVKATDANGCFGTGATYTLTISCQTITVTNPATTTGTAATAFSQTFTASNTIGPVTFTTASTLPAGLSLSAGGVLSGTPTQTGTFPIVVTATDANGCKGTGSTYNLVIACQTITVTNPSTTTATAGSPFSQQFTQTGAIGGATFSTASTLPAGITLSGAGLLSGTPTVIGTFPIVVTVTDGNGCSGSGATYNLIIGCPTITVTNPSTNTATVGTAFSQQFTQTGAVGGATFSTSNTLPNGLTLDGAGLLSGTPTQSGSFPIVVTVTDGNGCTGTGATYTLTVNCQTITVTNPGVNTGTANTAFSQTFTQSGALAGATFSTASTLPAGLSLSSGGVLSGTPTQTGPFPIVVTVTDGHGCTGTGATYNLTISCQTITVTNPATNTGVANSAFSQTFTAGNTIGATSFTTSSALPAGLLLATNGTLSGTPSVVGTFPIVVTATDANGCQGSGATYNLTISCQVITVTNPATTTGTAAAAFSQTFTASNTIGSVTFTTASTLPAGLTLSTAGVLSGTPTQTGSFPIVVTATDANGCSGNGATYNLTIACQTITVTNPATNTGTVSQAFSQQFNQSGAIGGATFSTASTLPAGITLSSSGLLSGTPLQTGSFPIVVTVTDSNGCTGSGATYNLVIACQTITVGNPSSNSDPAGTALVAANFTFTQSGAVGGATFSTSSTLPTGVTLSAAGVLTGTPTQGGSFPIVVTVTDGNGCTGTNSPAYTLTITCPTITVTNPGVTSGTAGVAFSQTFTQSGGLGTITWSESGALPTGITLNTSTGVLSGTTHQAGVFPITVTATDQNGCQGSGATYTLTINCQTITVTNPGVNTGTVDAAFSQTFTVSGILDTVTWSESGALPAGITLNAASGVLSGTPTVNGVFPITVKATDTNLCFGTSSYTLTVNCQTITVTNPVTNSGTVDAAFSQTFTQGGAHGTATFSTASTLPAGLSLSTAGVLSGTPTVKGSFPIVVTVTDSNGCTGTGATYTLTINCQTITVTKPVTNTGTVNAAFSQTFTQSGAHATATFSTASTLPAGLTLSTAGVLSGTPTQPGSFPIVVTVTDANGCTGTSSTYTLSIACQTITVTNPATTTGTVATAFSQTFLSSGGVGSVTFSTASTLPAGLTLHGATGVLDGTPTQSGTFPIAVKATDSNGCFGTGATYTLAIACNVITVTDPATTSGTAGQPFTATFTQSGGNGTITWSTSSTLPAGITLNSSTGVLSGTPTQVGAYPLVIKATDGNGCSGDDTASNYTLTINCNVVTITNATSNSVQAGTSLTPAGNWTFSASGNVGTVSWTETGSLPTGITLSSAGVLSGSSNVIGSYPITVKASDSDGCFNTSAYTLTITCPTITPARNGGGAFPAGTIGSAYSGQSFTASGGSGTYTFAKTSGTLPSGLSISGAGAISGTPTATGTFTFTVTATDSNTSCTGSASFSIAINPVASGDSYSNLVNNTQAVVTGGTTSSPATPFVGLTGSVLANDSPLGGVAAQAGTVSTTQGGSVTIAADGTFIYTPPVTATALTTDSFNYTINSDTGATGTPTSATGTVTLNLAGRVWYVKNNVTNGNGQSQSPFNSTSNFSSGARISPDKSGDIIYIYAGDGTTTNQTSGVALLATEQLIGNGVALSVNGNTLVVAGTKPQITNTAATSDAVTLNDGNTVKGLTITGATRDGIAGASHAGFTGDTLTINTNTASGLHLTSMTGTVTVTNASINGNATGLDINNGTAAITLDNTNTITSGTGRTVSIQNRPALAGTIALGASITDSGTGILVSTNTSGTINFTGTQSLNLGGTNTGINLTTNTGTTMSFSGTLGVTTVTGSAFNATGGGTINVTGTANITTGAAATGVNINGVTVGASGVTFTTVNTTGATTGVSLTSLGNGNVTINGGTISGGTTGLALSTLGTSTTTLAGVTITGATTGISGATFGTLSVGSSVNVSGATALNLATGAVSGTFANVSSTGGTNGVNLSAVTGTWGASAGTLQGATGATFNVSGTSGTVTWGGTINQANAANVVTIAGGNSNSITFSGNVTTSGTSTGISITGSTGTYAFNGGASTILGTGGGVSITSEASGTITFGSGFSIGSAATSPTTSFTLTSSSANVIYNGAMTNNNNGGKVLNIDTYSTGTANLSGASSLSGSSNGNSGVISTLNNITGTVSIGNLSLTSGNNNFNNTLVAITGTNTGGSITFNNLTLSATGTGHTGKGLTMVGSGTLTFTGTNSINVSAVALDLNGQTMGASTIGTVSSSGGTNGVKLTSIAGSALTMSGGTLTGSGTGSTFLVSGGNSNITYGGTTSQANAQRVIDITGRTGGTVTISGAVTGSGSCTGVTLGGSGGTVTMTGGMTLDGANDTFSSTTAGLTINVTGTNTIGATTAPAGPAVNIANTSIGASNVTFRSVSATGGANGIVLNATGSGTFTITGNAGTCTSLASTCTGGTIQNTTSHAISLNSTLSPVFNFIKITNIGTSGIYGTNVTNFTLANSVIDGVNTSHTAADSNIAFNASAGGSTENNLSGTVSITNNTLNNSYQEGISIKNFAGTISNITINNNSMTSSSNATLSLSNAIALEALRNSGGANFATITTGTINNNSINNFPGGAGVLVFAGISAATGTPGGNVGTVGSPFTINGNTITGSGAGAAGMGTNGIQVTASNHSDGIFTIGASGAGNTITNVKGDGIACSKFGNNFGGGTYSKCLIAFNIINAQNTVNSPGINSGADNGTVNTDTPLLYLDIHNNTVSNTTGNGILSTIRNTNGTGVFSIVNNTVNQPIQGTAAEGIRVDSGNGGEATGALVCLTISGNNTTGGKNGSGSITAPGIGLRQNHGSGTCACTSTFNINGLSPNPASDGGQMEGYVNGLNPSSASGTFGVGGTVSISSGATYHLGSCVIP